MLRLILVALLILLSACQGFSSTPVQVNAHFGEAVRAMQLAQTYNPKTRLRPSQAVIWQHDGNKQQQILNNTYRADVWQLESKRNDTDATRFLGSGGQ